MSKTHTNKQHVKQAQLLDKKAKLHQVTLLTFNMKELLRPELTAVSHKYVSVTC